MAFAAMAVAGIAAAVSLVVGAGEQVLDARRPTAVLVALGVSPTSVRGLLRAQLSAAAVLPCLAGAALGWLTFGGMLAGSGALAGDAGAVGRALATSAVTLLAALLTAAAISVLGAGLAARVLRGTLNEAMGVQNLRTA